MKEETTSKSVKIQLPPSGGLSEGRAWTAVEADAARHAQKFKSFEEAAYGETIYGFGADEVKDADLSISQVLRQALIESKEPYHPKPVTPKEPSAAPIVLGIILFLVSVAGLISVGLWYAWPSLQKYAEGKGWTEPTVPKEPAPVMAPVINFAPKVTYYHVSCVSQLATGRINFYEFHYSMTEGEEVNPLVLIHNLRQHAAQIAGSTNVMILAISHIPGGAK